MIIKPLIRSNVFLTAHPLGCAQYVNNQIKHATTLDPFKGPENVLIIGGSSGYGLATRIALAVAGGSNTINVSYESGPKGERTGSAGWWNNKAFLEAMTKGPTTHQDFVGDAFSKNMKEQVLAYLNNQNIKLDLIVYSLAAGARSHEVTNELVHSHIKTIGESITGKTIDIASMSLKELTVVGATPQEISDTIFVMGGSDWKRWIDELAQANRLNDGVKTIAYTYVGSPATWRIYRSGTLGKAKADLEQTARYLQVFLSNKYQGEALISSSKATVTKASVFIPQMPIYVSCLIEVMTKHGVHETTLEHKHRLFMDMVYGNKRLVDSEGRLRLDSREMDPSIQAEVAAMMETIDEETIFNLKGTQAFIDEFYQIHGFRLNGINYDLEVNFG